MAQTEKTLDWEQYLKTAAQVVSEGIVMLKNDNDALPLNPDDEIALFGRIQLHYYKSGTGSGGMVNVSKITGIPDIERRSFCHVLNSHAMAIRYAQENGLDYNKLNLIVAHLGGGISASVHAHGQIIDSVGDDDGQFSPERSGCVPSLELIRLCYSG